MLTVDTTSGNPLTYAEIANQRTQTSNARRDRDPEIEEGLGGCARSRQTTSHASHHGLYVRELAADILNNDGFYAVRSEQGQQLR
jgi:hypothetical protein